MVDIQNKADLRPRKVTNEEWWVENRSWYDNEWDENDADWHEDWWKEEEMEDDEEGEIDNEYNLMGTRDNDPNLHGLPEQCQWGGPRRGDDKDRYFLMDHNRNDFRCKNYDVQRWREEAQLRQDHEDRQRLRSIRRNSYHQNHEMIFMINTSETQPGLHDEDLELNALDPFGKPLTCGGRGGFCRSIHHTCRDCPHERRPDFKGKNGKGSLAAQYAAAIEGPQENPYTRSQQRRRLRLASQHAADHAIQRGSGKGHSNKGKGYGHVEPLFQPQYPTMPQTQPTIDLPPGLQLPPLLGCDTPIPMSQLPPLLGFDNMDPPTDPAEEEEIPSLSIGGI